MKCYSNILFFIVREFLLDFFFISLEQFSKQYKSLPKGKAACLSGPEIHQLEGRVALEPRLDLGQLCKAHC